MKKNRGWVFALAWMPVLAFVLPAPSGGAEEAVYPSRGQWPHMPYVNMDPGPQYADSERMFQGIPSIAAAPGGRLWATWYGGGLGESSENYVMLATSGDGGETWSPPVLVVDPPFRASEPALWLDPTGKLWFMFNLYPIRMSALNRSLYKEQFGDVAAYNDFIGSFNQAACQLWVMTADNPDAEKPAWSAPRLIAMETHNMNKPIVLSNGDWLWPSAPLPSGRPFFPSPLYSEDNGTTFSYRGDVPIRREDLSASEYQVVERKDGSLWLLNRVAGGIGESISRDGGRTWTMTENSPIVHTVSRFFITRLQSGSLLLVKHGAIDRDAGRSQLMAFVSDDDGQSWTGGLMLDERQGISYPDGVQSDDGMIRIIYDYSRHVEKEILVAQFTEEDVRAGEAVSGKARFRMLVNRATGINPRHEAAGDPGIDLGANQDGEPLLSGRAAVMDWEDSVQTESLQPGALVFSDRGYQVRDVPAAVAGKTLVRAPLARTKGVCREAGIVYVLTPSAGRGPHSRHESLTAQGFALSDVPEFHLFNAKEQDVCSLYQKEMAAGEVLEFGAWGVPVLP